MSDAIRTVEVDGRIFEKVPRVLKCVDPMCAMMFIHTADNPYGNPMGVWEQWQAAGPDKIRERLYGVAIKQVAAQFAKFNRAVHVIDDEHIPEKGTNYHFMDPAGNRNWFMHWYRETPGATYIYREWPGNYDIPGHGVPEPWAVPDAKKLDGKKGGGQKSLGWGYRRYKLELARLEGWKEFEDARDLVKSGEEAELKDIDYWNAERGAREKIEARYVDSRAASNPRMENDRPTTILDDLADIHLYCDLTPGDNIDEGCQKINDLLDYNENQKLSYFNQPRLFIAKSCVNTIFSMETWTNADGQKGACKDPIDLMRYKVLSDTEYVEEQSWMSEPGGSY